MADTSTHAPANHFDIFHFVSWKARSHIGYGAADGRKVSLWLHRTSRNAENSACSQRQDRVVAGVLLPVLQRTASSCRYLQSFVVGQLLSAVDWLEGGCRRAGRGAVSEVGEWIQTDFLFLWTRCRLRLSVTIHNDLCVFYHSNYPASATELGLNDGVELQYFKKDNCNVPKSKQVQTKSNQKALVCHSYDFVANIILHQSVV